MYDYSKKVGEFHEDHVRLTNDERSDMRKRRETNLKRVRDGLAELGKPEVAETINQGGYAQKTMTQPPEADDESRYDIDLGVVFEEDDAAGPRTTRNWVRDAIAKKATNMRYEPESKKKCVRVVYADGYQCDFPVFRRKWKETGWAYELSSGDEWVASDPRSMNSWIDLQVSAKSPELTGSYQLRRLIRFVKFFCKVHAHRVGKKYPSGLVATALAIECYSAQEGRDDLSLRETLRGLSNRSKYSPVLANGCQVSDDKDVDRIQRLIDEAKAAVEHLDGLNGDDVTAKDARKAWKKVFRHSFFDEPETATNALAGLETKSALSTPALSLAAISGLTQEVRAERMQSAVDARIGQGGGSKPWASKE
ncbi:cyclic GMP-AMP synthase DncV-like nucleotidyltransferase [Paracoccus sp. AS002]|uniref:cyclic GMP-AMP synthase DncV-like nucleotidyltransferase n=1 Tax=Paracoccus sp. AS002 TaxID=3019545 RepID=UPI0023E7D240|nr:hypothetical protein [Paracoccus sp. AS002]MDF3907609.1 hypothetical protein [Paracoccus sp. AS002]